MWSVCSSDEESSGSAARCWLGHEMKRAEKSFRSVLEQEGHWQGEPGSGSSAGHLWQKAADRLTGPDYKLPSSRTWS